MNSVSGNIRKSPLPIGGSGNIVSSGVSLLSYNGDEISRNHGINNFVYSGNIFPDGGIKTPDNLYPSCESKRDSAFMYSQANGVPQESKLATYMNHQNTSSPNSIDHRLSKSLSGLNMDYGVQQKKAVAPQGVEFMPGRNGSPSFLSSYSGTAGFGRQSSVESPAPVSPRLTPQPSPPLTNCSPSVDRITVTPFSAYQENVGGTTYFYPTSSSGSEVDSVTPNLNPLSSVVLPNFHMYTGDPNNLTSSKGKDDGSSSFYISDDLRMEALHKTALVLAQPDPDQYPDLPKEIDNYHELCPLDSVEIDSLHKSEIEGYPVSSYKATNIKTGVRYCFRRIHDFRLLHTKCISIVDSWKRLQHSNIVQLREVFTTKAFGDYSMIFVYDYHPGSKTLLSKHFTHIEPINDYIDPFSADPNAPRPYSHQKNTLLRQQASSMLPESLIWNYITQLTAALRAIHAAGLACRTLDPSKILLTSGSRIRLGSLAIPDVLTYDSDSSNPQNVVPHYQQEDLTALGKVVLALACRSLIAVQRENIQSSLDMVSRAYSSDLRNLIMYLLSNQQQHKCVTDLMPMIGARFYTQLEAIQNYSDNLENELTKEMENGRLCRLLVKLGSINERPEFILDPTWSETGNRYLLKLFRDYLFHQVTEDGRPWLDMSHVVQCLNKLDAGAPDKVCLTSPDQQSVLVVTYTELKHCLEQSFDEVLNAVTKTK